MRTADAIDDTFITLVCQDEDLLRSEFDALIAASWQEPPSPPPAAPQPADRPPGWPAAPPGEPRSLTGRRPAGTGVRNQRSPPRR